MLAAYIDCPSGVSGDMLLGALLDAGLEIDTLRADLQALPVDGFRLEVDSVRRGTLAATQAHVVLEREEQHERRLSDILEIIASSTLAAAVKDNAGAVFRVLAAAEARIHGLPQDELRFHEVGALDAIVDIVGVCAGFNSLGIERVYASPLPLGRGQISSAHGILPLPAPAVLELLAAAHAPTVPHAATVELVTPTGAALLVALAQFEQPPMRLERIGYGAGSRTEPEPNVVRLCVGELDEGDGSLYSAEQLLILESNIDDMPAELFAYASECFFAAGALDVWCTPIVMKKGRPATMLSAICSLDSYRAVLDAFLRETSTFGVRMYTVARHAARRESRDVETSFGSVQVKVKVLDGYIMGVSPEYEDCRRCALEHGVPLHSVYAAISAVTASWVGAPIT